eukprot:1423608-Rhodomonas_salina.1
MAIRAISIAVTSNCLLAKMQVNNESARAILQWKGGSYLASLRIDDGDGFCSQEPRWALESEQLDYPTRETLAV